MDDRPDLHIDRSAPVDRISLGDGSSWVDVCRSFIREPRAVLDDVVAETPWHTGEVWRYDHYVTERRLGAAIGRDSQSDVMRQSGLHLRSRYGVDLYGVTAILYRDGEDFQGLHSDREMKWLDETLIAIVVLGEPRPFRLRPRRPAGAGTGGGNPDNIINMASGGDPDNAAGLDKAAGLDDTAGRDVSAGLDIAAGRGDLLVMGGRCQRDWLHGVPAVSTPNPRVSLTWRWSSRRGAPDTAPKYADGRQLSDRPNRRGRRTRPIGP